MPSPQDIVLSAVILFGHFASWVATFNRLHALPLPCKVINRLEKVIVLLLAAVPGVCVWWFLTGGGLDLSALLSSNPWFAGYATVTSGVGIYVAMVWCWRKVNSPSPAALVSNHTTKMNVAAELQDSLVGSRLTAVFACVPLNEMFELHVHEKTLSMPSLPSALDGLTIAHISDLHFTGRIKRPYFDYVISEANKLKADLVAVTGDIVEKAACIDWLPETLGQLESRYGKFSILGNHDKRISNIPALRNKLEECGMIDLGLKTHEIELAGERIFLAGNEMPWFGPAVNVSLPESNGPANDKGARPAFRMLLSHSPDQLPWARKHGFDLMLAGHTHGGQIRFPVIGPVVAPSNFGVKYASGLFYEPPTLMHVSRGISGLDPIRINCPPELTKLILRSA